MAGRIKALLSKEVGGPETLVVEDVASPVVGSGQVLVSVKACGVNFPDVLMIEDKYQARPPRPFSPGGEVSGVIKAVDARVRELKVGDRVLGFCGSSGYGGMAHELTLDAARVTKIPDSMPFDEAAAFLLTYGTAYYALKHRAQMRAGETLLVLGAAGGVGLAAVELAAVMGAKIVAAASSQEKIDLVKAHGADVGVVYPSGPFERDAQKALAELFKSAVGARGADVIFDTVGGDYAEPAFRAIAWEGRYLVIGFAAGNIPKLPLNLPLLKGADIRGVFWGAWTAHSPEVFRQSIEELLGHYVAGKIRPHISERFPLARGGQAIAHLASRKALGKVVVTMD
jgi:NADPH2:quinone reductase